MSKPWSHKVIALLALIQGVFGLLRAYNWVQIGTNLFGQGLLLLPFVGAWRSCADFSCPLWRYSTCYLLSAPSSEKAGFGGLGSAQL
jgi:hypothetical protein